MFAVGIARISSNPSSQYDSILVFKARLLADSKWGKFLASCGSTQPKVKQTALGALAPPTQKVKGRYMNIGDMFRWGQKMLALIDGSHGELPPGIDRSMLLSKYGWIKEFRTSLSQWNELDILRECEKSMFGNGQKTRLARH